MGKDKKDTKKAESAASSPEKNTKKSTDKEEIDYEQRLKGVNAIAHPLAPKKLTKKVYKTVKKAAKSKQVKRGVKEVVKGLRKGSKGVVVIAGDIQPIDVIAHVPVLCEENNVPYIYVPSKEDLGLAGSTKRPTSVVMIVPKDGSDFKDSYDEVMVEVKEMIQ